MAINKKEFLQQEKLKKEASLVALEYIKKNSIIGIGTGSTIKHFLNFLSLKKDKIKGAVSTSYSTSCILKKIGIKIFHLNKIKRLAVYIDSADEIDERMNMIKGGGAALTCEKIVAANAKKFICIVDQTKQVKKLGKFPLPIEIIPISYNFIKRKIIKLGGFPKKRNTITEHGNIIVDIHNLDIKIPLILENYINSLPGVVTVGLFAARKADVAIIATTKGIKKITNGLCF